jgi:hypothetical protein
MTQRRSPGSKTRATSTTPIAADDLTAIQSQQVSWWPVREYFLDHLNGVDSWPMAGTPEWCSLGDDDPAKLLALLDAAQHWVLRVETCQQARCDASQEIREAADWNAVAKEIFIRTSFYAARPWLKRVVS